MNTPAALTDLASKCAADIYSNRHLTGINKDFYNREETAQIILSHFGPELAAKEQELERLRKALGTILTWTQMHTNSFGNYEFANPNEASIHDLCVKALNP